MLGILWVSFSVFLLTWRKQVLLKIKVLRVAWLIWDWVPKEAGIFLIIETFLHKAASSHWVNAGQEREYELAAVHMWSALLWAKYAWSKIGVHRQLLKWSRGNSKWSFELVSHKPSMRQSEETWWQYIVRWSRSFHCSGDRLETAN